MDPTPMYPRGWRPTISMIIPTLNEAPNLEHVLPRLPDWIHELIVVDGGSTDGTPDRARELWPGVRLVAQQGKGKGDALRAGFAAARGDIVAMLDADGSMDPAELPAFVAALVAGADLAKGSRFLSGGGSADFTPVRRAGAWALTRFSRVLFGTQDTDLCYGYAAFWRHVLPVLALTADGFEIETELIVRAHRRGLRVVEVPSFEAGRIHGASNLRTFRDGWRVLRTMARERGLPAGHTSSLGGGSPAGSVKGSLDLQQVGVMDGGSSHHWPASPNLRESLGGDHIAAGSLADSSIDLVDSMAPERYRTAIPRRSAE